MLERLLSHPAMARLSRLRPDEDKAAAARLPIADARERAREHVVAACRALAGDGLSHAQLFHELRMMTNRLESGGLAPEDWPSEVRAQEREPTTVPLPAAQVRKLLAATWATAGGTVRRVRRDWIS